MWHVVKYLRAVVNSLQDCRKVWAMFRTVLPTLGHDPIATNNRRISDIVFLSTLNVRLFQVGDKAVQSAFCHFAAAKPRWGHRNTVLTLALDNFWEDPSCLHWWQTPAPPGWFYRGMACNPERRSPTAVSQMTCRGSSRLKKVNSRSALKQL